MLAGGVWLAVAATALGETRGFDPRTVSPGAWLALLYLVVAGSIAAFTAYMWLLHHDSPTRVGTYAYVNPVVAVLLGYFAAANRSVRVTVAGTACVPAQRADDRHDAEPPAKVAEAVRKGMFSAS